MKTLRLIGMAIVAVIMSVNFAACSDDDDEGEGKSLSEKLVGHWVLTYEEGYEKDVEFIQRMTVHGVMNLKMSVSTLVISHSERMAHTASMT